MRRTLLTVMAILIMLTCLPVGVTGHIGSPVTVPLLKQPVTVDGKWTSTIEWTDAQEIQMSVAQGDGVGYFRIKHDATYLYILAESLTDVALEFNHATNINHGDLFQVWLDTSHNEGTSPQKDDYKLTANWVNETYTELWWKQGDGNAWAQHPLSFISETSAMISLDNGNSPHAPHPHVIGEFKIPLHIIPGSTFGFFIRLTDSQEDTGNGLTMWFYWPGPSEADQNVDPSSWGVMSIS